eukprot:6458018-Amphidinium_carterae.1
MSLYKGSFAVQEGSVLEEGWRFFEGVQEALFIQDSKTIWKGWFQCEGCLFIKGASCMAFGGSWSCWPRITA